MLEYYDLLDFEEIRTLETGSWKLETGNWKQETGNCFLNHNIRLEGPFLWSNFTYFEESVQTIKQKRTSIP
jgi:hypothetical protein